MLVCAWCGKHMKGKDKVIGFEKHSQLIYRTGLETTEGPQMTETKYFCSTSHRHEYLFGL